MTPPAQTLHLLPGALVVERRPVGSPAPDGEWLALVRGTDGLTVVRPWTADEDADDAERWRALEGRTEHDLDLPGMLLAVVRPLGEAGVPVFVTSTFAADVVLVPAERLDEATGLLEAAGHAVRRDG
ncbi:ACT domain-containing protein [Patulibacter sp. S7RM1-6]